MYCQICEEKGTRLHDVKCYKFTQEFDGVEFRIEMYIHPECVQKAEFKFLEFSS